MKYLVFNCLWLMVFAGTVFAVPIGDVVEKGQWVAEAIYSRSQTQSAVTNGVPFRIGYGIAEGFEIRGGSTFSDSAGGQSTSYLMAVKWQVSEQNEPNNWADVAMAIPVSYAPAADSMSYSILIDMSKDVGVYTPYFCFGLSGTSNSSSGDLTYPVYVGVDYKLTSRIDVYGHIGASASNSGNTTPTIIEIGTEIKVN